MHNPDFNISDNSNLSLSTSTIVVLVVDKPILNSFIIKSTCSFVSLLFICANLKRDLMFSHFIVLQCPCAVSSIYSIISSNI